MEHFKIIRLLILFNFISTSVAVSAEDYVFATHTKPPVSDRVNALYTEIFSRMGHNFKLKLLPGLRTLRDVNNGKYDGDASRIKVIKIISSENIENYRIIDEPLFTMELVMITSKDVNIEQPSWEQVNKGMVSYIRGSERVRGNILPINRVPVGDAVISLRLVDLGRVKSAVLFRLVATDVLKKDNANLANHLKIQKIPIEQYYHYGFVHKKNKHLIPLFIKTLKAMKKDGSYNRIIAKYSSFTTIN